MTDTDTSPDSGDVSHEMGRCVLRAVDLQFEVPVRNGRLLVFEQLSLAVQKAEVLGILGPNGCGKTSLLRILARLANATSGRIQMSSGVSVGMIFQNVQQNLVPWRTAIDNAALPMLIRRLTSRQDARERAMLALRELEIESLAHRYPNELSGGQQQLMTIARWMACPPQVLLIDEGWSMLDIVQRERAAECLTHVARTSGTAVCLVNHNVSELASVADRVLILSSRPARMVSEVNIRQISSHGERSELLWQATRDVFSTSHSAS